MVKQLATISGLVLVLFWGHAGEAVGCDPEGRDACVAWAEAQITSLGCSIPEANLEAAIGDLYLNQGCRLEGTRWYEIQSGQTVKGSVQNGINTDSAGCIARYTPSSYLNQGGFFRTPKETLNGSLRNVSISNCSYDGKNGKQDASALTGTLIAEVQSCGCAKSGDKPKPKDEDNTGGGSEPTGDQDLECNAALHLKKNKEKKKCECSQLYKENTDEAEKAAEPCVFSGARGIPFDVDSAVEFQLLIERLTPGQAEVFEGMLSNGETVKIGVLKLVDGSYTFSRDGFHYYDQPSQAYKPGWWRSTKNLFGDTTRNIARFFGIGKYAGEDTAGESGKEKQQEGQRRFDAASESFIVLKERYNDPEKLPEMLRDAVGKAQGRNNNILDENWGDLITDEVSDATGIDIGTVKKVLGGDVAGIGADVVKKIYTLPAESVHILAKDLQKSSFTDAAHQYMKERTAGKTPGQIRDLLLNGELPELDFTTSVKGVTLGFARASLFQAYEEAYQRYLLNKSLKP